MTETSVESYFGEPWPSGVCDNGIQVPTPVGVNCILCSTPVAEGDQGSFMHGSDEEGVVPAHKECSLRSVLGGIGHHLNHDYWCLQQHDPDGGRTFRQSALEVWEWVIKR